MKFLTVRKDGGPDSYVTGFWLIEIKSLFSIAILRFDGRSREAYHSHAFNCISWVIKGLLWEHFRVGRPSRFHRASWRPFGTRRSDFHMVDSVTPATWVLTFRGPWAKQWREYLPTTGEFVTLESGRKVIL